jgi:putative ABC transport system ATP-binding protein
VCASTTETAKGTWPTVSDVLIDMHDVRKIYRMGEVEVQALSVDHLEIHRGEFLAILGPSGSGKTTLLNLLGGIDTPSSGRITFAEHDISHLAPHELTVFRRDHIGFVFQFFNLIPTLTAEENVRFALELVSRGGSSPGVSPRELLERVGLAERAKHFPSQLSGGEQQRVAVARALAKSPELILGDEPTGNLDFRTGKLVLGALREVNREQGAAVVLVTHNAPIASIADRVLYLRDGAIVSEAVNERPVEPEDVTW